LSTKLGLTRLLKSIEKYNFTLLELTVDEKVLSMEEVDILVEVLDRNEDHKKNGDKPKPENIPKRKKLFFIFFNSKRLTKEQEETSDDEEQEEVVVVKHVVGSITPRMSETPVWNDIKLKSTIDEVPKKRGMHQRSTSFYSVPTVTKTTPTDSNDKYKPLNLFKSAEKSLKSAQSSKTIGVSINVQGSSPRDEVKSLTLNLNKIKLDKVKSNNYTKYEPVKGTPDESKFCDPYYVARLLYHDHPSITKLDLRGKIKQGKDLKIIMPAVDLNNVLKELDISDNNLEGRYFSYVKEALKRNQTLEVLKMDGNLSTKIGLKRLIKAVKKYNNTLIDLKVDESILSMEEVDLLMEVIDRNEEYKKSGNIPDVEIISPRERLTVEEELESDEEETEKKVEAKHFKSTEYVSPRMDPGWDKKQLKSVNSFKLPSKETKPTIAPTSIFKNPFKRPTSTPSKLEHNSIQKSQSFSIGNTKGKYQTIQSPEAKKPTKKTNNYTKYEPVKGTPDESKFSDPYYVARLLYHDHPDVTKLDLRGKIKQGKDLKIIMPAVDLNNVLKELDISDNNLEGRYFSYVKEALKRNQTLEVLKMDGNLSTKIGLKRLIDAVSEYNFTLIDLKVDESILSMEEVDVLMEVIDRNEEYKKNGNIPEPESIEPRERLTTEEEIESDDEETEIKVEQKHFTSTPSFKKDSNDPDWTKSKNLKSVNTSSKNDSKLNQSLSFKSTPSSNGLQKSNSFSVSGTLPDNVKYQGPFAVQVHRSRINDRYLTSILLKGKKIDDEVAQEIFDSLKENLYVKKLNLQDNLLTDDCIPSLIELLKSNIVIDTIELEGNNFTSTGIDSILVAMKTNYSVTDFGIHDKISDDQIKILDKLLDRNFEKSK
jgi:hypothetical protein